VPADHDDLADAFRDLTGHYYGQEIYEHAPHEAGNANEWIDLFSETGIDFENPADTVDAFENFLIAFYPQTGMSGDDWYIVREEFFEMYQMSGNQIDWQAYREAIGY
jgi:hypothetical protein